MEKASEISGVQTAAGQPAPQPGDRHNPDSGWPARAAGLREQHWQIGQELLELGRSLLGLIRQEPQSAAYLAQVHRLLDLGAELSRQSSTDALNSPDSECPDCCAARKEWEDALNRIYGKPLPEEETILPTSTGAAIQPSTSLPRQNSAVAGPTINLQPSAH